MRASQILTRFDAFLRSVCGDPLFDAFLRSVCEDLLWLQERMWASQQSICSSLCVVASGRTTL